MSALNGCPFTRELLDRLLQGEADDREKNLLISHLEQPCPHCEQILADLPETYDFLLAEAPAPAESISKLSLKERARIFQRAAGSPDRLFQVRPPRSLNRPPARWLLLAAGLLMAAGLFLLTRTGDVQPGAVIKSGDKAAFDGRVLMQFIVALPDSKGGTRLIRGENDGRYPARAKLAFRAELNSPAFAYLVRVGPDRVGRLLYPESGTGDRLPKGTNDLMHGRELFQFPLEQARGVQTFCLTVFPEPPADLDRLAREIGREITAGHDDTPPPRRDGMDCFRIRVEES